MQFSYSTHTLFIWAIKALQSNLILDVGCLDGKDSLIFKEHFPAVKVLSFEANPYNYKKLIENKEMTSKGIEVHNLAVSDKGGFLNFYIYNSPDIERDGIASLKKRINTTSVDEIRVKSTRLDEFLGRYISEPSNLAIWIDVEGAAFDVIKGLGSLIKKVGVIHVELEKEELYQNSTLQKDVNEFLVENKFKCIGKQLHASGKLGDYVYVNKGLLAWYQEKFLQLIKIKSFIGVLIRRR